MAIAKIILLTILIQTIKSKDTKLQEMNLSDDSRPRSAENETISNRNSNDRLETLGNNENAIDGLNHAEQKIFEHNGQTNHIGKDSRFGDKDVKGYEAMITLIGQNRNIDEDSRSNLEETSEYPGLLNRNTTQSRTTISEHDSRIQDNKARSTNQIAVQTTAIKKQILEKGRPQNYQKTSEQHSHPKRERASHLYKRTMVSDNDFAYMVAVMKGATYVCAGALIDESWVLTAASGIHIMRETMRFIRIRLGSINYKKGGTLLPIKYFETHPYFNSSKAAYDIALIMLSKPVWYTAKIRSIRLQLTPKEVTATHYIMTSWPRAKIIGANQSLSIETIKHYRILSVAHLHPSDSEECFEELREIGAAHDEAMCFSGVEDACMRDIGAPVVINSVLWGVISSWRPQNCDDEDSIFATLVSAKNISTWIHATVHGHRWHPMKQYK